MSGSIAEILRKRHEKKKEDVASRRNEKTVAATPVSPSEPITRNTSVAQLGKDYLTFTGGIKAESVSDKLDDVREGVREILSKMEGIRQEGSSKVGTVNPGESLIYVNVDDIFIGKGRNTNVSADDAIELIKRMKNITVVNMGGIPNNPGFSSDIDIESDNDRGETSEEEF
ncbi:hypothetical protein GGI02_000560 [Coemansia sp. RSA 2322]|nr:hypothetical protein GGI02_000560 [Coemansia sp. RSA 2322]KAJ2485766.1 hypothetical protein EV174_001521 [Coemansia sp. RSA 2320]